MSYWTYITGMIIVSPMGCTQPQKRYVLDTVLAHLPVVSGSESNMKIHVVQRAGYNGSSSLNEFDEPLCYRRYADNCGWMRIQSEYILVLEAALRDRVFDETKMQFNKWLNRLSKRLAVMDILIRLEGQDKQLLLCDPNPYIEMYESPSWFDSSNGEPAWAEYLLWEQMKDTRYPMRLAYKYHIDPENDAEVERRNSYYVR